MGIFMGPLKLYLMLFFYSEIMFLVYCKSELNHIILCVFKGVSGTLPCLHSFLSLITRMIFRAVMKAPSFTYKVVIYLCLFSLLGRHNTWVCSGAINCSRKWLKLIWTKMALIIGSNNVTINSWDELFNTSWLSLQRVHVSLFDLGSYHVHMLWIRFF